MADVVERRLRQPARAHDAREIAAKERDAGAFDRDIGAGAHGDADVGGSERRRVVDAVAGHGDDAAVAPQFFDDAAFLLRQNLGLDFGDAELARHRLRGDAVVAGEHHDAQSLIAQRPERVRRGLFDRVGDTEQRGDIAVGGEEDHGRAVVAQPFGVAVELLRPDAAFGEEFGVAERDGAAVDGAGHALAGRRVEVAHGGERDTAPDGCRDDGGGERMFARPFDAAGKAQRLAVGEAFGRHHRDYLRLAFGQERGSVGADGKVDTLVVDKTGTLYRRARPYQWMEEALPKSSSR